MSPPREIAVGDELPTFQRTTGFHHWNRYAAVNDEFVPIHMDDEAGRAAGYESAFGMGNLQWAYLHDLLRQWMGDSGRILQHGLPVPGRQRQGSDRDGPRNGHVRSRRRRPAHRGTGRLDRGTKRHPAGAGYGNRRLRDRFLMSRT